MATKAVASPIDFQSTGGKAEDLYFFTMPLSTYKLLADAAAARNMPVAQALGEALSNWVKASKSSETEKSQLLVETNAKP